MQTLSKTVVFTRPFTLSGFNGTQPAGPYVIETDALRGSPDPAWQRRSTLSRLYAKSGANQRATVCTAELEAALLRDSADWTALRFETPLRRAHRTSKKAFFDSMAKEGNAYPDAKDSGMDR